MTHNTTALIGWCDISREKKEVWEPLGHLVFLESLYVKNNSESIWRQCAFVIVFENTLFDFRAYQGEMERMEFQGELVKRFVCFDIIT